MRAIMRTATRARYKGYLQNKMHKYQYIYICICIYVYIYFKKKRTQCAHNHERGYEGKIKGFLAKWTWDQNG